MAYDNLTPQGVDKVARYKWNMQDEPGVLAQVNKHKIMFDKSYQRNVNDTKVLAIASDWSWLAMGVITLADRNGLLYAVDGMHRVSAALRRSDIQDLPCIIFKTQSVKQEAKGFIQSNTLRKAVTTMDKHKAMVLAGDSVAIMVQRMIDDAGFVPATSSSVSNGVKCFGVLHRLAKTKPESLDKAWPVIVDVCRNRVLSERIIEAFVFLVERASDDITKGKWRNRINEIGFDGLKRAAEEAASYYARGGARVWADGMVKAMNKGMRYRLELDDAA